MGIGGNLLSVELDIPVFPAGFVEVFEVFHLVSCFPRGGDHRGDGFSCADKRF